MGEGVCKEREGIKVGRCKEGLQTRWDFVVSNEDEGDCCIKGKERVIEHPSPCSLGPDNNVVVSGDTSKGDATCEEVGEDEKGQ